MRERVLETERKQKKNVGILKRLCATASVIGLTCMFSPTASYAQFGEEFPVDEFKQSNSHQSRHKGHNRNKRPNIIILLTDDQGYGDRGIGGNPDLGQEFRHPLVDLIDDFNTNSPNGGISPISFTPNLDKMRQEGVSLTDYHVTPACATTRAQLMTGRDHPRTNVLWPITTAAVMDTDEITIGELFSQRGYTTGMFGKWNLGPAFPSRPQDQGFDKTFFQTSGANSATSNAWDSDCYGDTFFDERGRAVKTDESRFCGDVPFEEGLNFVEKSSKKKQPFLAYIATSDPHWLRRVGDTTQTFPIPPEANMQQLIGYNPTNPDLPAGGLNQGLADFFSQVSNTDRNLGLVRAKLEELGIADNTIIIVGGDNGSAILPQVGTFGFDQNDPIYQTYAFDGKVAGGKFETRDGGHRNFLYAYYPDGGITCEDNINRGNSCFNDTLSSVNDVVPTMLDLAGFKVPRKLKLDGVSRVEALRGDMVDAPAREIFTIVSGVQGDDALLQPPRDGNYSVRTEEFLFVNSQYPAGGFETVPVLDDALFNIATDPEQLNDISDQHPNVVQRLKASYDRWYDSWADSLPDPQPFTVGSKKSNPVPINSDTIVPTVVGRDFWSYRGTANDAAAIGPNRPNLIEVKRAGTYRITARRWPFLGSGPGENIRCPEGPQSLGCPIDPRGDGQARLIISPNIEDARTLTLSGSGANYVDMTTPISSAANEVSFEVFLRPHRKNNPLYIVSTFTGVIENAPNCDITVEDSLNSPGQCPIADGRNAYHLKVERLGRDPRH